MINSFFEGEMKKFTWNMIYMKVKVSKDVGYLHKVSSAISRKDDNHH